MPALSIWDLIRPQEANASMMPMPAPTPGQVPPPQPNELPPARQKVGGLPMFLASNETMSSPAMADYSSQEPEAPKPPPKPATRPSLTPQEVTGLQNKAEQSEPESDDSAMNRAFLDSIKSQQDSVANSRSELRNLGERPSGFMAADLSPVASLVDTWTGSNLAQSYRGPSAKQDYDKQREMLMKRVGDGEDKLSKDQLGYLKMKQDADNKAALAEARMNAAMMANASRNQGLDLRTAKEGGNVVSKIHNDPMIVQMRQSARNIDNGQHLLEDPNHPISWKTAHEILQDYAQALSGKGIASDYKVKSITQNTLDEKRAELAGFLNSDPNQPANQATINFLKDMGSRLSTAYDRQLGLRAANKLSGLKTAYASTPGIYNSAVDAAKLYQNGKWRQVDDDIFGDMGIQAPQQGAGGAKPALSQQEQATLDWAKKNPTNATAQAFLKKYGG